MYTLYYRPANASFAVHVLLEEIGAPFELKFVDKEHGALQSPEYLALNPAARVPAFVDGDLVLFETAAICLHLCDRHPEANMAPPVGSDARAQFYKWLVFCTNTIQTDVLMYYYPRRHTTDPEGVPAVKQMAGKRLHNWFTIVEDGIEDGPFLLGGDFTVADVYLTMLARWVRSLPEPPHRRQRIGALARATLERPCVQRAVATEGIAPFFGD